MCISERSSGIYVSGELTHRLPVVLLKLQDYC
jgi:hypothetical protein